MILKLIRKQPQGDALHGKLYIDGVLWTEVLERRGVEIPALWYTVNVTISPKFKRLLPIVNNVPGRSGIRFHVGTKPEHSAGCILVPSREIENRLTQTLLQAQQQHETIYLEIIVPKAPAPLYDVPCPKRLQNPSTPHLRLPHPPQEHPTARCLRGPRGRGGLQSGDKGIAG